MDVDDVKMETVDDSGTGGDPTLGAASATANGSANGVAAAAPSMLTGGGAETGEAVELANLKMKAMEQPQTAHKAGKPDRTQRIDIDSAMTKFQRKLGRNWDKYRDTITHFLMGKLSRPELAAMLSGFLTPLEVRTHNYLLLAILANSLREPPPGEDGGLSGWKTRGTTRKSNVDTPTELLHREIMALPARERKRIKNIARDNKRPNVPVPQPCLIATRQAMLPHLPYVQDRAGAQVGVRNGSSPRANGANGQPGSKGDSSGQQAAQAGQSANQRGPQAAQLAAQQAQAAMQRAGPGKQGKAAASAALRADFSTPPPGADSEVVGADGTILNQARTSGPLTWTQDIIHGFEAPLAGEMYELPDDDSISERVLGIALEHGVTNGYEAGVTDVLLAGVEQYLRGILSTLAPMCRNRSVSPTDPITARDMQAMFTQQAGQFREMYGPLYRISTHYLRDEETATEADLKSNGHSEPPADKPENTDNLVNPWAIGERSRKRTAQEAALLQSSDKGKQFVRQLMSTSQ